MSAYDHPPDDWDDLATDEGRDEWDPHEEEEMLRRAEQRQHDRDLERDTLDRLPEAP